MDGELAPRRYSDLLAITLHYAPDFDERKYWAYGCNCLILGDRPMSEMGKGKPVDEMDVACKEYKSCQKCVRMEFGDVSLRKFLDSPQIISLESHYLNEIQIYFYLFQECIGEREKYSWKKKGDDVVCTDNPGTCKRSLCECDLNYAKTVL